MNKKQLLLASLFTFCLFFGGSGIAQASQKVDVCHSKGNGSVVMISVSINALPAHLDHGDFEPEEYFEDFTGTGCFDETNPTPSIFSCEEIAGYTHTADFPNCSNEVDCSLPANIDHPNCIIFEPL